MFEPRFRHVPGPGALLVDGLGLRVFASGVTRDERSVRVPLEVAWRLPEPFAFCFRSISESLVVQAEGEGVCVAEALLDPERPEEDYAKPYDARGAQDGHPQNIAGGYVACTLVLPPCASELFVHVTLLSEASNVLAIDATGAVRSFHEGKAHAVRRADLE